MFFFTVFIRAAVNDSMAEGEITVVVVDDDLERCESIVASLQRRQRFSAYGASTVDEAQRLIDRFSVDCVVTRASLTDGTAIDVFRYAAEEYPAVGRVLLTAGDRDLVLLEATEMTYTSLDVGRGDLSETLAEVIEHGYEANAFAPYPVPRDEQQRVAVATKYREKSVRSLQRLVHQAADRFDVETASIRVVDRTTQHVLASTSDEPDDVPRSQTICTHTIAENDVVVIDDIERDNRVPKESCHTTRKIKWYAGAPITIEGQPVGTFCLEDTTVQEFTRDDENELQHFARRAAALLTLEHAFNHPRSDAVEEALRQVRNTAQQALE